MTHGRMQETRPAPATTTVVQRNGVRPVRDLKAGTVVRLPEELGRLVGCAEGGGSTRVLVPGRSRLEAFDLPGPALVEVIATPTELAVGYLRGDLGRIDRRWRRGREAPAAEPDGEGEAA